MRVWLFFFLVPTVEKYISNDRFTLEKYYIDNPNTNKSVRNLPQINQSSIAEVVPTLLVLLKHFMSFEIFENFTNVFQTLKSIAFLAVHA